MDKDNLAIDVDVYYVIFSGKKARWSLFVLSLAVLVFSGLCIGEYGKVTELLSPQWVRVCGTALLSLTFAGNIAAAHHMLKRIDKSLDRLSVRAEA